MTLGSKTGLNRRTFLRIVSTGAAALCLASCGGQATTAPSTGAAADKVPSFEEVLDAAKQEGTVEMWTDRPDIQALYQEAFNKRLSTNIKVTGFNLRAGEAATRLITEARGGKPTGDLLQPSYDIALDIERSKLFPDPYPWVEVFGKEFPAIKDSVEHIKVPIFKGRAPTMRDVLYHGVYRTDMIKPQELPKTFEALGEPQYKGKVAFDNRGTPLEYLVIVPGWNEQRIIDLARNIKANAPRFFPGSQQVRDAVVNGQAVLSAAGDVTEAKQQGQPVDNYYLDPTPVNTLLATVPKTAPHPNAARLFAVWVSLEGPRLLEEKKIEYRESLWQKDLVTTKALYANRPDAKVYYFETPEQVTTSNAVRDKLAGILTGTG